MKKFFFLAVPLFSVFSVFGQSKEQVTFAATIANGPADIIVSVKGKPIKTIKGKDGLFKESFAIEEGVYELLIAEEYTKLYLKNGLDVKMKMDVKQFDASIVYEGNGAAENNLLAKRSCLTRKWITTDYLLLQARMNLMPSTMRF